MFFAGTHLFFGSLGLPLYSIRRFTENSIIRLQYRKRYSLGFLILISGLIMLCAILLVLIWHFVQALQCAPFAAGILDGTIGANLRFHVSANSSTPSKRSLSSAFDSDK